MGIDNFNSVHVVLEEKYPIENSVLTFFRYGKLF